MDGSKQDLAAGRPGAAWRRTFHGKVVPRWWEAVVGAGHSIHACASSVLELVTVEVGNVG